MSTVSPGVSTWDLWLGGGVQWEYSAYKMKLKNYFKTLKCASEYYFINSITSLVASVTASYLSKLDSDHVFSFLLLKLFLFPVVGSRSEMAWFWPMCKETYKTQGEVCRWLWRTLPETCMELSSPFPSVNEEL